MENKDIVKEVAEETTDVVNELAEAAADAGMAVTKLEPMPTKKNTAIGIAVVFGIVTAIGTVTALGIKCYKNHKYQQLDDATEESEAPYEEEQDSEDNQ